MYLSASPKQKKIFSLSFVLLFTLGNLTWKSNIISDSLTSVNKALDYCTFSLHRASHAVDEVFDSYRSYKILKEEVTLLREKLKKVNSPAWQVDKLKSENARLRQILNLRPSSTYKILQAEIISNKPDNWLHSIVIDRGSRDGVKTYMPVIANQVTSSKSIKSGERYAKIIEGLVGKIIQVNSDYSRILLITSKYSKLGVEIKKAGHWALLEGQGSLNELPTLNFLHLNVKLKQGEPIITSGSKGVFPKGIPVGRIHGKVKRMTNFQITTVKPFLNFQKLDYVFIIQKNINQSSEDKIKIHK